MKSPIAVVALLLLSLNLNAAELAGVHVDDTVTTASGDELVLNGIGLREKLWIDVYVGSLYLPARASNVAEIIARPGPVRIDMDIIYKEISPEKFNKAWKEGFEKNQPPERLKTLQSRIDRFYTLFEEPARKGDKFILEYIPGKGTSIRKNGVELGVIEGEDFKNALLEIWLGNHPADKSLKKGMLGLK